MIRAFCGLLKIFVYYKDMKNLLCFLLWVLSFIHEYSSHLELFLNSVWSRIKVFFPTLGYGWPSTLSWRLFFVHCSVASVINQITVCVGLFLDFLLILINYLFLYLHCLNYNSFIIDLGIWWQSVLQLDCSSYHLGFSWPSVFPHEF